MRSNGASPSKASKRAIVFQLGSLTEVLQSLIALRAAKQLYPQLEISLVVRDSFQEVVDRVPWIAHRWTMPNGELLGLSRQNRAQALVRLGAWVSPFLQVHWDYIVNWTTASSSGFLATLPPGKVRLGLYARKDLSLRHADGWSQYLRGVIQDSKQSLTQGIHLTDLWTTQFLTALQIHEGAPKDPETPVLAGKGFFQLSLAREDILTVLSSARKWIGIQLDTSEVPLDTVTHLLAQRPDFHFVFLGKAVPETLVSRAREIQKLFPNRILNLLGQTDFDLWASVLSRCHWLVAGESPAVQLASLLGTQVLQIRVNAKESLQVNGPYGNGHYVLCQKGDSVPTPEQIAAVFGFASSEWSIHRAANLGRHLQDRGLGDFIESCNVVRSRIRTSGEGGGVRYDGLLSEPWGLAQWNSYAMSQLARHWYCGWTTSLSREMTRSELSPELVIGLRGLDEVLRGCEATLSRGMSQAGDLTRAANKLVSSRVMSIEDRSRLQAQMASLAEIDSFLDRLGKLHPVVCGLANLRKVLFNDLEDADLAVLGRSAGESYRQLLEGVGVLRRTISETLEFARPRAITKSNVLPFAETSP